MTEFRSRRWVLTGAGASVFALALAGCSRTPPSTVAGAGAPATPGSPQDFAVNVGDRVFFTVDSSNITPTAADVLNQQAAWLQRYPQYQVTVEGHADERGTREYNIALSARRADATRNYLASRGVPASRMRTISFGKERPVAVCDNETCWNQNRRAVTILA
ncbi:peptidoglycan-associated lipoprotein Pal [Acuticoccus sp.]|uniref:peptidoglycan-associated lipoprotein Pal n=1 Tax=Acuticoccus sp. TaxID=1904378 RepID=UPI003B51B075